MRRIEISRGSFPEWNVVQVRQFHAASCNPAHRKNWRRNEGYYVSHLWKKGYGGKRLQSHYMRAL